MLEHVARELRNVLECLEEDAEAADIAAEHAVELWAEQHGLEYRPVRGDDLTLS